MSFAYVQSRFTTACAGGQRPPRSDSKKSSREPRTTFRARKTPTLLLGALLVGCSFEFNRNFYEAPPPHDGTGTEDTGTGTADTETDIEDTGPGDTGTGTINTGTETADTGTGNGITSATLKHRWRFNGNLIDEVGGSDAVIIPVGAKDVSFSETETEIVLTGGRPENVPGWVSLGSQLITDIDGPATLEIFATTYSIQYFSRILDFGANEDNYLTMTWTGNSNILSEDVVGWWWDSVVKDSLKNNTNAPITSVASITS
jgi:hypothetical protein